MTREDRKDFLIAGTVFTAGVLALVLVLTLRAPQRPRISNSSTYAQVLANFAGRPYATGSYLSGFTCAGYTAGKSGHGWVVIRCVKQ